MKRSISTSLGTAVVRVLPAMSPATPGQKAPPWVFLHGASGSWRTFRAQMNQPHSRFDLVFLDLPGWGDSEVSGTFAVHQQSRAVVEVLTSLGYRSWYLFGHSMGAVLALDIAASCPAETHAVLALSPTALTAQTALSQPFRHPAMAPLVGMYVLMVLLRAFGRQSSVLLRLVERLGLLRLILSPLFARPFSLRRQVFEDLAIDARPASFIAASSALRKYDAGIWRSIATPTVLARGSKDIFTRPAELHALAALLPHAHAVVLADAGHFAHLEDPAAVSGLLSRLRPASDSLNGSDGRDNSTSSERDLGVTRRSGPGKP